MGTTTLPVNGRDDPWTYNDWYTQGGAELDPWLDSNDDWTSAIYSGDATHRQGFFTFTDLGEGYSPEGVILRIKRAMEAGTGYCEVYLNVGESDIYLGEFTTTSTSYTFKEYDITSHIGGDLTKLNNAKIYFKLGGTGTEPQHRITYAELVVTWSEVYTSLQQILTRTTSIKVGKDAANYATVIGIESIAWKDSDPWVVLPIPAGESNIYQHLRPVQIEGKLICKDVNSMYTAFYETDVDDLAGNQYAIDPTTGKKNVIEYFVVYGVAQDGTAYTYTFTNVRVKTISIGELKEKGTETPWIIEFYAEKVVKS